MCRHLGDEASRSVPPSSSRAAASPSWRRSLTLHAYFVLLVVAQVAVVYVSVAESLWRRTTGAFVDSSGGPQQGQAPSTPAGAVKATETWAGTAAGQVCHRMFPWRHEGEDLSYMLAWDKIRPAVLNASYYPPHFANESRFRNWVSGLFEFYSHERLQRSQAHPAPRESIRRLWEVLTRRLEDPANNEPVRIAFFGGSVTTGRDCDQNPLDFPGTNNPLGQTRRWCAYPQRLHVLLNEVLFPHRSQHEKDKYPLFEVVNMAVQATNSEVGAMALEYGLLPSLEDFPPHVVVSSYSANDAEDDEEPTFWKHQQSFVRSAHGTRPCDDHLPLVVLADDCFTHGDYQTMGLVNTGSLFKTATWHNVMAVMYANVVRSAGIFHSNFTDSEKHPLFGSARWSGSHLGMGFHIAQGWTIFFNLVGALHDACTEPRPRRDASSSSSSSSSSSRGLAEALPTKYIGRYEWAGENALREWEENAKIKARLCDPSAAPKKVPRLDRPPYATATCEYAWVVNAMTNVWTGYEVQAAIEHVLVDRAGWEVDEDPKAGFRTNLTETNFTRSDQSQFTIELRNITQTVDTFTLLSLKSYGPEWVDSSLWFDIYVIPAGTEGGGGGGDGGDPPEELSAQVRASVDGYHEKHISVSYPHRFHLNAQVGDTIRATFILRDGKNFKITGIAFCRSTILTDPGKRMRKRRNHG